MINESSLSRLKQKMDNHSIGIISAFRGDRTYQENISLHQRLKADLMSKEFDVTVIKGSYIENKGEIDERVVDEKSLFVSSKELGDDNGYLESVLIRLGELLEQDSILSKRYDQEAVLIGTTHRPNADITFGERVPIGEPTMGKLGDYFSKVRRRPFIFETLRIIPPEYTNISSLRSRIGGFK